MTAFVLDASMALAWYFRDEFNARASAVSRLADQHSVVVPKHWFAEVGNGMWVGERSGRTNVQDSGRFAERLSLLDLQIDDLDPEQVFSRILPLARAHRLTIYDTLYLEIAERRGLPLASFDKDLNAAARQVGIELVEETP